MKKSDTKYKLSPSSPTVHEHHGCTQARIHLVVRYPGWWHNRHRLPKRVFKTLSGCDGGEIKMIRPLTVAGAAQVRFDLDRQTLLLPVELRRVNHTASTNRADFSAQQLSQTLQCSIYVEIDPN